MQSIGFAKVFVVTGFEAISDEYGRMQSIGIPALREAGAARLGTWKTIVPLFSFPTFPGAPPLIPLAVGRDHGGGSGGMQSVGFAKVLVLIRFLEPFQMIAGKCSR